MKNCNIPIRPDEILIALYSDMGVGKSTILRELEQLGYTVQTLRQNNLKIERAILHRTRETKT